MNKILRKQVEECLDTDGIVGILKHASISVSNKHYCTECFCCACLEYLNDTKPIWQTIVELKAHAEVINYSWFSPAEMIFFNTKIASPLIKNRFFVTSDKGPNKIRAFAVHFVLPSGKIDTLGEVCQYKTKKDAMEIVNLYKRGLN